MDGHHDDTMAAGQTLRLLDQALDDPSRACDGLTNGRAPPVQADTKLQIQAALWGA